MPFTLSYVSDLTQRLYHRVNYNASEAVRTGEHPINIEKKICLNVNRTEPDELFTALEPYVPCLNITH